MAIGRVGVKFSARREGPSGPKRPGHSEALVVTGHIPSASKSTVPEDSV